MVRFPTSASRHLYNLREAEVGSASNSSLEVPSKNVLPLSRAPQGKRLVDKVPHGHWKTTTFICGLRYDGVTAPFVLDGPMDGPYFLAYVEQILAPTLKKGQIVFLDNVSTHKVDGVEDAIEARGARAVFLPAYSPDLRRRQQKLVQSNRCKTGPGKAVAGRPVASVA